MTSAGQSDRTPSIAEPSVRVMIVEDSPTERYLLCKMFERSPDFVVAGLASNGLEALDILPDARPDIICSDYHMPVMDGLEFILKARKISDCPIVVLSIAVQSHQRDNIFKLLSAGAVAVVAKPTGDPSGISPQEGLKLLDTIREIVKANVPRNREVSSPPTGNSRAEPQISATSVPELRRVALVAIGASTGGPQILSRIFSQLPRHFPVPIVCVQHISTGFLEGMINWLQHSCKLPVEIATSGAEPRAGHIYFAPDGSDLTIDTTGRFSLQPGESASLHCPAIDALFRSVSKKYQSRAVGILLSGMGRDGAAGLKVMRDDGAATIVQNESTSIIFGMPAAAISLGAAGFVLSTDDIARAIAQIRRTA